MIRALVEKEFRLSERLDEKVDREYYDLVFLLEQLDRTKAELLEVRTLYESRRLSTNAECELRIAAETALDRTRASTLDAEKAMHVYRKELDRARADTVVLKKLAAITLEMLDEYTAEVCGNWSHFDGRENEHRIDAIVGGLRDAASSPTPTPATND